MFSFNFLHKKIVKILQEAAGVAFNCQWFANLDQCGQMAC